MDSETRQRLLELVYGLLPEAEAAELRSQIDSDEEMAQAFAEAQEAANLIGDAAKQVSPKMEFQRPERPMSTPADSPKPKSQPTLRSHKVRAPWVWAANWTVAIAAALLLIISVGGYFYHRDQLNDIAAEHMRLIVTGPAELAEGSENVYTIQTRTIVDEPFSAQVKFALYSPDGTRLIEHQQTTNEEGVLPITIPSNQALPDNVRMHVVAMDRASGAAGKIGSTGVQEEVETVLAVEPIRYATKLSLDKPLYRPGETVRYRSLTLSRTGMTADREMMVAFEIVDPSGAVVADSQSEGVTNRGVGCGEFAIPAGLPGGEYTLIARALDEAFPEERQPFFIRQYRLPRLKKELEFARDSYSLGDEVIADFLAERAEGGPAAGAKLRILATVDGENVLTKNAEADETGAFQITFALPKTIQNGDGHLTVVVDDGGTRETISKTIPINLGKVNVRFFPEGGYLVPNLENRVYFTATDPLGEPVHIEGTVLGSDGRRHSLVETLHEGMGSFALTPRADVAYRLRIDTPVGIATEPKLPDVSVDQSIVMSTGNGVFEPGKPLEFNIRASKPGLPLVVAAYCRGVPVGQQDLVTEFDAERSGSNSIRIPIADEVGGVIRLTVYDYRTTPPTPVAERLVYRRLGQKLNVAIEDGDRKFAPGETVELELKVTDEQKKAVTAALGIAVTDDALLNLADDDTPGMPTHFLLLTEVENSADLEDADFYLSDEQDAAIALDLLLGTQGWRRFVEKTLEEIRQAEVTEEAADGTAEKNTKSEEKDSIEEEALIRLVAMGSAADPPAMFDNLNDLNANYSESLDNYRSQRTHFLNTVTAVSFFAGLGLVLFVAMLGLLKVVQGVHLWVPAVGVTICCLIIGAILMDPSRLGSGPATAVAFSSFDAAPMEVAALTEDTEVYESEITATEEELPKPGDEPEELLDAGGEFDDLDKDAEEGEKDGKDENGAVKHDVAEGGEADEEIEEDLDFEDEDRLKEIVLGDELVLDEKLDPGWAGDLRDFAHWRRELEAGGKWADLGDREEALKERLRRFRFVVREYAHTHKPAKPGVRSDFTETLYWNPLLIAKDGKATVKFDLSDSVTTFRVLADAHGEKRIGAARDEVVSRIPFSLEPKLPLEVNAGDRIDLPLAVANDSDVELPVEVTLEHGDLVTLDGDATRKLDLAGGKRAREYFVLDVTGQQGDCALTFRGTAGHLVDAVERPLIIVPPGFPKSQSFSGEIDGDRELVVELPEYWVPGSLSVTLNAYPSTLADLQKGMDSILREPYGCFEQASTSNYPNVLSLQYMQEHDVANPAVTRRAKDLLKKGYVKLVGYECPATKGKEGYEWFGSAPAHEALTAYGLMEFRDMAEVYEVDQAMIDRTASWLLTRRDGKGGFLRNPRALDSFGAAPEDVTNAYITWALSESGQEGIEAEVNHLGQLAMKSDDPYVIALAAQVAFNAEKENRGRELLEKLAKLQKDDGQLLGTNGSITRSGGQSLAVETTALAAMAFMADPSYTEQANKVIEWITASRSGAGGFGSTQATILALKALVEHSKASRKTLTEGTLEIKRDDQSIGQHAFAAGATETIVIDGIEASLESGENKLTISLSGENKMPYSLDVAYRTKKPVSSDDCPVRLTTTLAGEKVNAGETIALRADLSNITDQGQPMTVAILGLPAGLEPRHDQLDELKKAGLFDYYETRPREVICYWRALKPNQKIGIKLDLVAAVPGRYTGPASRAYLYYTAEQKQWDDPLEVEITRE